MCCCIPLRKLSIFGTSVHVIVGCFYIYLLIPLIYRSGDTYKNAKTYNMLQHGLVITIYIFLFFPIGILLLTAVYKKMKKMLIILTAILLILYIYGILVQYNFFSLIAMYEWKALPDPDCSERKIENSTSTERCEILNSKNYAELIIYSSIMITYILTLFFYIREIEDTPLQPTIFNSEEGGIFGFVPSQHTRSDYNYSDAVNYLSRVDFLDEPRTSAGTNNRSRNSFEMTNMKRTNY